MKKRLMICLMISAMCILLFSGCGKSAAKGDTVSLKDSGWQKTEEDGETFYTTELTSDFKDPCVLYYPTSEAEGHGYCAFLFDPSGTKVSIPQSRLRNNTFSVLGGYRQDPGEVSKYGITFDTPEYETESYPGGNKYTVTQIMRSESLPANSICIVNIHCGSSGEDQIHEVFINEKGEGGFVAEFIGGTEEPGFEAELIKALVPDETDRSQETEVSWGRAFEIESVIKGFYDYYVELLLKPQMSGFGVVNVGGRIHMNAAFIDGTGVLKGTGLEKSSIAPEYFRPYEFECEYLKQF